MKEVFAKPSTYLLGNLTVVGCIEALDSPGFLMRYKRMLPGRKARPHCATVKRHAECAFLWHWLDEIHSRTTRRLNLALPSS